MNKINFFNNGSKRLSKILKSKTIVPVYNAEIPYDEIKNQKQIAFIVISKDETVLKESIEAITEFQEQHKDLEITVFISSSYEKLHRLTNGAL